MSLLSTPAHALVGALVLGLGLMSSTPVFAEPGESPPDADHERDRAPRRPPQVAYDACVDLAQDEACEVEFDEHTITGTCAPDREDGTLFCRPDHPPRPPRAEEHAACSFSGVQHASR